MKQITGRIWLGRLKVTFSRVGAYFGYINFLLLLMTFYSVTGYKYAPLWLFIIGACFGIIVVGAIDYFVMLPSELAFANQQSVRHQNPIYDEIKKINEVIKEKK